MEVVASSSERLKAEFYSVVTWTTSRCLHLGFSFSICQMSIVGEKGAERLPVNPAAAGTQSSSFPDSIRLGPVLHPTLGNPLFPSSQFSWDY